MFAQQSLVLFFAAICLARIALDAVSHLAGTMPLFGLRPIRVTDEASKRVVHVFACRDEPMPLAVDCSPNAKRRSFLVLCLRPGQTPLRSVTTPLEAPTPTLAGSPLDVAPSPPAVHPR